jgi:hypothetical protein
MPPENFETNTTDIANVLAELPTAGADDYVRRVIEVYEQVMDVYGPSEVQYSSALRAGAAVNGFSNTTNG